MSKRNWIVPAVCAVANFACFVVMLFDQHFGLHNVVAVLNFGVGMMSLLVALNNYASWAHYRIWSNR